jgi:hypothetical protein
MAEIRNEQAAGRGVSVAPLLSETFEATEGIDVASGYSVDDWQSAYESATRLTDI